MKKKAGLKATKRDAEWHQMAPGKQGEAALTITVYPIALLKIVHLHDRPRRKQCLEFGL